MTERPAALAKKLAFFGAITASLSHELKNVLATINEFSGLLDDLCQAAAGGRALEPERLVSISGKIHKQVKRGENLIQRLNRFAHSVDAPLASIELKEQLERICTICDRFAKLGQASLERRFPEATREVETDPFALQQIVYLGVRAALAAADQQRKVTVALELDAARPVVAVESADSLGPEDPANAEHALLRELAVELGADLSWEGGAAPGRIALTLPA